MKNTRQKGNRLEFDTVNFMKALNVNFFRVGMSGQLEGMKGDFKWIESGVELQGEAKSGKQAPLWLYKTLEKDKSDFLVVKRDRKERLWVLKDSVLQQILKP